MSYLSAILIFIICILLAVAVCAPLIFIARRLRRRRAGSEKVLPTSGKMPVSQVVPGLVLVVVLFLGFAHQYIAPESWLGAWVSTSEGRFWVSILVLFMVSLLNYLWIKARGGRAKSDRVEKAANEQTGNRDDNGA